MKDSQQRMMPHSEVKVRLLKLYLEQYLNILSASKYFGGIHVYDLFCGEGIYENRDKGSPIVILETIKNIYFASKAKNIASSKFNCYFNDLDTNKIEKLKSEIQKRKLHYAEIGNLIFSSLDYQTILPDVIKDINALNKERAFVFIDPYGYKDIKVVDIKNLMQSNKSEVLLFLPTQFMFRFKNKGTPECLVDFISELMPIDQWPIGNTGIDFIENLTEAFRNSFGKDFFIDSFIITRDKNQFFCLFFFTRHIYGFDRMLTSKWDIDKEEGRGWQFESENTLFSLSEKKPNTYKFEIKLIEYLKSDKTNRDIYEFTLYNGHLPSHTNEILLKYQNAGKLIAKQSDGSTARKSAFYINYKAWKDEPNKIQIKII